MVASCLVDLIYDYNGNKHCSYYSVQRDSLSEFGWLKPLNRIIKELLGINFKRILICYDTSTCHVQHTYNKLLLTELSRIPPVLIDLSSFNNALTAERVHQKSRHLFVLSYTKANYEFTREFPVSFQNYHRSFPNSDCRKVMNFTSETLIQ